MRDIKGYEGLYKVTEDGNIYNIKRKKFLKNVLSERYLIVLLYNKGKRKRYYVHRLVAQSYCSNEYNKEHVNHIDLNKTNNHYSNLEWVTCKENVLHYRNSDKYIKPKFTIEGIESLKRKLNKKVKCNITNFIYESIKSFAEARGISITQASQKLNNVYENNLNATLL